MNFFSSLSDLAYNAYGQIRGYNRWRIDATVKRSTSLSGEQLRDLASQQFRRRVLDAIKRFPFYADRVRQHRGRLPNAGESFSASELPVWTKADQKEFFSTLTGPPLPGAFLHTSGGSTGVPSKFYVSRESYEWRIAVWRRGYTWGGAAPSKKSFHIWVASQVKSSRFSTFKQQLQFALWRRRVFEALRAFDEEAKKECCRHINRTRPAVLVGYSGYLVDLARFVRNHPELCDWHVETIVPAAEGLQPGQRELLETSLGGKVTMSYGAREFMLIGMECARHNGYHLSSDNLLVEVVDDAGEPVDPDTAGRIVITDLHNLATPFIRYEIGDLASMPAPTELCPCGLPFPLMNAVEGRTQSFLYTTSGDKITAIYLNFVLRQFKWMEAYQLEQLSQNHVVIHVVTRESITSSLTAPIADRLRERLGAAMKIDFNPVDRLEKGPTGKIEYVKSGWEPVDLPGQS